MDQQKSKITKLDSNPVMAFVGMNKTGKTALAKMYASQFLQKNPTWNTVVFDPQSKLMDVTKHRIYNVVELEEFKEAVNTVFIFDEARLLFNKPHMNDLLMYMLSKRDSHANNNIFIFIVHNLDFIQNFLYTYINMFFVFATQGQQHKIYKQAGCLDLLEEAVRDANKAGRGAYPNFNYCIINTDQESIYKSFKI